MGSQGTPPTGVALLVLVMALVLSAIVVIAILIPGARAIARRWQRGEWPTILEGLGVLLMPLPYVLGIGIWKTGVITTTLRLAYMGLTGLAAIVWAVALSAGWYRARTRAERSWIIAYAAAATVWLSGNVIFILLLYSAPTG